MHISKQDILMDKNSQYILRFNHKALDTSIKLTSPLLATIL